jgi:8-oxo-dGTP diphosphatase
VPTAHNGGTGGGRAGSVVNRLRKVATAEQIRIGGTGQSGRGFAVGGSLVEVLDGSMPPRRAGQCHGCSLITACVEGFWALRLDPSGRIGACLLRDDLRVSIAEHLDHPEGLLSTVEDYVGAFEQGRIGKATASRDGAGGMSEENEVNGAVAGHDVGVHLILIREGRVLLGRRANTGFADGGWHVPGGRLDPGETLPSAAIREAAEELGITVGPEALRVTCVCHHLDPDGQARVGVFFHVTTWDGEPVNAEPAKCSDLRWFDLGDLPTPLVDYARIRIAHADPGLVALQGWDSTDEGRTVMAT